MSLSTPFIHRPVATTLLMLAVTLAGLLALRLLPVSPLPQVDYPTLSVSASLPGASPETMAATVATPLERSLGRIAGITEMTSQSSLGSTRITLQFELSRDIDAAAREVQAAINAARALLPTGMPSNPSYRKVNPSDAPIMIVALTSDTLSQGQIYDAAATVLAQKLAQVQGVGQVDIGGSSLPAVRVSLNPTALNRYGLALDEVSTAIAGSNPNRPKGMLDGSSQHWHIQTNDQARTAKDYLPLIIRYRNGAAVRLSDVAEVMDSVQDLRNAGATNGKPSVMLVISRQPNSNIIDTVDRVRALLPQLQASIPRAIDMHVAQDRTPTIRASLREVEFTLTISVALVILVVFLFLRNARAALIPSVAVPVSLIGTLAVMYLCGFSLNNLSLMALTVATGFVVDDAIVVLENISRRIEQGMQPLQAALVGAREVGFTVLSISISLIAVFIPILLMGGIVGRLFREFAITLSAAVLVSLLVSLTATPMMCARLLRAPAAGGLNGSAGGAQRGRLSVAWQRLGDWSGQGFAAVQRGYARSLDWALRHGALMLLLLLATIAFNIWLYMAIPKGFFPQQDTGRMFGSIRADQSTSFEAMRSKFQQVMAIIQQDSDVQNVSGFVGGGQTNSARLFVTLKPLTERKLPAERVIARLRGKTSKLAGMELFLVPVQDIRIGGRQSNAEYQYTLQADDLSLLRTWEGPIRQALAALPQLVDVNTDSQEKGLQTSLFIDRDAAARLGITSRQIGTVLGDAFSQRQVSTIYNPLNQYKVVMEVAPEYRRDASGLDHVYVMASQGEPVPLSAFSRYGPTSTPLSVNHQGQFVATTVSFNLQPGVSLSQATQAVQDAMARIGVPSGIQGTFAGSAKAFQDSLSSQPWLILAALLAVYIVLGILYESYIHPLTILSTLPSAGVGALLALMACKTEFSIIALIGVILLIGIVKKNAIMMIDFALVAEREQGLTPTEAIRQACLLRFRPIMMTTLAAMLGAVPLALGSGDGAELRQPLGISIVGGLLFSQMLTLYTTPVVYLYLDRFRLWCKGKWGRATPIVIEA